MPDSHDTEQLSIRLPSLNYKIKDKLIYNGAVVYVSDIIFSMIDFNWYAVLFEIDEKEIIQKNLCIPAGILNSASLVN